MSLPRLDTINGSLNTNFENFSKAGVVLIIELVAPESIRIFKSKFGRYMNGNLDFVAIEFIFIVLIVPRLVRKNFRLIPQNRNCRLLFRNNCYRVRQSECHFRYLHCLILR